MGRSTLRCAAVLAAIVFVLPGALSGQAPSVLHISVVLVDADRKVTPVPRHALLISDNPATAAPRLITTGPDGTADVRLRPGNYTVESDQPVTFHGKGYQWTQIVDVVAGRDGVLELTADNAEVVEPVASGTTSSPTPLEADPAFLLPQWQDSVVALWTPDARASGFIVDAKGLVATSQRAIGTATSVEVQLTTSLKVGGRVLAADTARDVAVVWIDPTVTAAVRPVPLGCGQTNAKPPLVDRQDIFTIAAPLRGQKSMTAGRASHVEQPPIASDWILGAGSVGGPVFVAGGDVVGLSSFGDEQDRRGRRDSRVVPAADVCEVVAAADKKMSGVTPPNGTRLPVEPVRALPEEMLKEAAKRRAGSLNPYQATSNEFDVAFITPVMTYGAKERPLTDFSNWSEYLADFPPVLLVRVTPRLVEGFWTTVARGAARTQGVALPPIKRFKSGFSRLRAFCGDAEVTPIHPLRLEQRVSDTDAIHEGLYVFEPGAFGPHCGTVKLVLYSEKEPEKGDTREVDPKVVQRIWQDFEAYRALKD
jgi:S1-C subfamily serine protease